MPTIDTVSALLAKAERTENSHEAEAYLAKAQELATLHAIDLAAAALAAGGRARATVPVQRTITIGEPRKRANPHLISLFSVIAAANDVVIDIAHNSTYVIAYGLGQDIDTVEALWLVCAPRMIDDAGAWVRSKKWKSDTVTRYDDYGFPIQAPATAHSAKATFCVAFVEQISHRLAQARADAIHEADEVAEGQVHDGGGAAVVLVAKAHRVQEFYSGASKARGSWRGYRGASSSRTSASARAGDASGRRARLTDDPELGSRAGELQAG